MDWPDDVDGGVMRRLQSSGFPFDRETEIDFNIDFDEPQRVGMVCSIAQQAFPAAKVTAEDGNMRVQVCALLSYPYVIEVQAELTQICSEFGGKCESWGVLWDPRV